MNVNVPAMAPLGPPETGASAKRPRLDFRTAEPTRREVLTSMVEHSMKSFWELDFGIERRPVDGFVKTSWTCGPLGSMVIIISLAIIRIGQVNVMVTKATDCLFCSFFWRFSHFNQSLCFGNKFVSTRFINLADDESRSFGYFSS